MKLQISPHCHGGKLTHFDSDAGPIERALEPDGRRGDGWSATWQRETFTGAKVEDVIAWLSEKWEARM